MAIITDHIDQDQPPSPSKLRPRPKPKPPSPSPSPSPSPFTFWFYLTTIVSITTYLFITLSSLSIPDPKTWFLTLPTTLRTHYSLGKTIKVQLYPNQPQVEVFVYSQGDKSSENVLIIHGLGCSSFSFKGVVDGLGKNGFFGVGIDLPGSGFSGRVIEKEEERALGGNLGFLGRVYEVYEEIKEKGIFWGFDNLIENGHLPYDEMNKPKRRVYKEKVVVGLDLGVEEVGRVIGQVVSSMGLAPVHLVLHDSGLVLAANWVVENSGLVRSVTVVDSLPKGVALPLWVLEVPVVREVVLGFDFVFGRLIGSCCSRSVGGSSVKAHRVLLKGRDGGAAIVAMGKKLNQSFDLGEWVSKDGMKGMPMQVLWSGGSSEEWDEEGKRVADVLSQSKFVKHSGGRWLEDTSSELAENIFSFVSSLPKTERKVDDEPLSEHIQKKLDEAKAAGHDHHSDGHNHDGSHAGYMDAYGLGHGHGHGSGWGM